MSISSRMRAALSDQTIRFLIAGGGAAMLFYGLSFGLVHAGASPFSGTLSAYVIAFAVSYAVQHSWTFSGRQAHARSFPRYLAAQIGCALLSGLVARACAGLGMPPAAMALVTTLATSACSYTLSRYWVFADKL